MSLPRSASQRNNTSRSRRGGRNTKMAIDTRYAQARRREIAEAETQDWRDWLIPSGVVAVLASITLFHHALLIDMLQTWL